MQSSKLKSILSKTLPVLIIVLGVVVVQVMVAAKPPPEQKEEEQRLISLFVDPVTSETVTLAIETQGEVRPKTEIELIPQVSGQIVEVSNRFNAGASFEAGATLIKIDDADYRLALVRAEARVAEANVMLEQQLAEADVKKKQLQGRTSNVTPLALNAPQVAEAKAKLESAQADLQEARLNLARTEIKVPFNGRVREKNVGLGQYVSAGTSLGRVFATDKVEVRLPLTDSQLIELNLPIGFEASTDSFDGGSAAPRVALTANVGGETHSWQGRIVRTDAAVEQSTRLVYATAEIDDPYGTGRVHGMPLAVGLFVSAEIEGINETEALVMPRTALRNADKVYVINDESKLEIRTVDVLSTSEDRVLVTAGVKVGERVVTSTIPTATDGMLVNAIDRTDAELELAQN